MDNQKIRLECLKLAAQLVGDDSHDNVFEGADRLAEYVRTGHHPRFEASPQFEADAALRARVLTRAMHSPERTAEIEVASGEVLDTLAASIGLRRRVL